MGILREILDSKSYSSLGMQAKKIPESPKSEEILVKLLQFNNGASSVPKENILEVVKDKFDKHYVQQKEVSFSNSDWRNIPWCLEYNEGNLLENEKFLSDYKNRLLSTKRRSEINNLISSYFSFFNPDSVTTNKIAELVILIIDKDDRFSDWKEKHENYSLFLPNMAPATIAKKLHDVNEELEMILRNINLSTRSSVLFTSFLAAIHKEFCTRVSSKGELQNSKYPELMQWSEESSNLNYQQNNYELLDALLVPWQDKEPPEELKNQIFDFILKHYKDPRVSKGNWISANEKTKSVFLKWITARSLEQFFSIVDNVAHEEHWNYRRKFWEAFKERGMEVWVIFGPECARLSKQTFGAELSFAKFKNLSGITEKHACLVIRLGNLMIAEWSHNGACRIWNREDDNAPKMYEKSYEVTKLKSITQGSAGFFAHTGSENYRWQKRIADYIYNHTNIRVNQTEYRL